MTAEIILLLSVVFIASLLQTSTGYGFSIIGTPFLLLLYTAHTAIQVNIVLSICLSAFMIFKIKNEVDQKLLITLIKGSNLGLIFRIFIYLYLQVHILKMADGFIVDVLTLMLIFKVTLNRTKERDFLAGGISGILTTSIGVPGPPLLLYFSGIRMDKVTLRSTTLAYYLFVYSASLLMQISFGGTSKEVWIYSLWGLPALFLCFLCGQLLFTLIIQVTFLKIYYDYL